MDTYDYVIVGAGSAGCVLANRLSADPRRRVLVLEAGGDDRDKRIKIPAAFTKLFKSEYDWNFATTRQPALADRELYWPRAKVLGGCSSMNAMMYVRGNAADYDLWEDLGNPGWGFRDVASYFARAEGTMQIEVQRDPNPATAAFLAAAVEAGIPRLDDVNGPSQDGVALARVNQRRGRRWSAADAYLRPAMKRANLTVMTGVHVLRVTFDGRRATGVELEHHGTVRRVSATTEIILAAGALGSPQLLMLSGVGPASELERHDIGLVHELPGVGQHLQDHLAVGVVASCPEPVTLAGAETLGNLINYLVRGKGLLTSNVGEACAFVKSLPHLAAPDLELIFAPVPFTNHGLDPVHGHAITIGVVLLQPKSAGHVGLASRDPRAAPRIEANYLSDPRGDDLRTLAIGVELARTVMRSPALARFVGAEQRPGALATEDFIRRHVETLYHPVGTCRMGRDEMAVVDAELRVRGLEGLRVADASIMPSIIRGHTHAPTVMIAEKAADLMARRVGHEHQMAPAGSQPRRDQPNAVK